MALTAAVFALGLDPAFVRAHHVRRVFPLGLLTPSQGGGKATIKQEGRR